MNVNDLVFVVNNVLEEASQNAIVAKYQELTTLIRQLQTAPTPELESQISISQSSLALIHKHTTSAGWSFTRKNAFENLACEELLGSGGINFLNRTFSNNIATNPQTIIQDLEARVSEINTLISNLNQIKTGLGGMGEYKELELPAGNTYLEIVFDKEVPIKSVEQLQKQSDDWVKVFQGYKRLFKEPLGEVNVVYINKVNPVILGLAVPIAIAQIFEKTVSPILRTRNEWLKGQILAEKLKGLKFQNYILKRSWASGEIKLEEETTQKLTDKIMSEHKKTLPDGTTKEEVTNFVKHNTEFIFNFIKNGGTIDLTEAENGEFTAKLKLSTVYQKMKALEVKAKNLLEAPKLASNSVTPKKP